jgi:hypothetical protein
MPLDLMPPYASWSVRQVDVPLTITPPTRRALVSGHRGGPGLGGYGSRERVIQIPERGFRGACHPIAAVGVAHIAFASACAPLPIDIHFQVRRACFGGNTLRHAGFRHVDPDFRGNPIHRRVHRGHFKIGSHSEAEGRGICFFLNSKADSSLCSE